MKTYRHTIFPDFCMKLIIKGNKSYTIEIWEISFDNIENIKILFLDANCVFLLYDSMDKKSFEYEKIFIF